MDDVSRGFFSLVRWRADVARDEARNVAVLLVAPEQGAAFRSAPVSAISPRLKEQGLLDSILTQLEARFRQETRVRVEILEELHRSLQHSLYVTEPQSVAVRTLEEALDSLYRAYLATAGGGRALTKGVVLDRAVTALRRRGLTVRRGVELGEFLFDALAHGGQGIPMAIEALSFATSRKDWNPVLHDAGHYLYALERVDARGLVVVQPPGEGAVEEAQSAFRRVERWLDEASVMRLRLDELEVARARLPL